MSSLYWANSVFENSFNHWIKVQKYQLLEKDQNEAQVAVIQELKSWRGGIDSRVTVIVSVTFAFEVYTEQSKRGEHLMRASDGAKKTKIGVLGNWDSWGLRSHDEGTVEK